MNKKLQKMIMEHTLWIFTQGQKGKCADFSGMDLSDMEFKNISLYRAKFTNANLENTMFYMCNLENADFTNANLENSWFFDNDLESAKFNDANLTNSGFSDNMFYETEFYGAKLKDTDLLRDIKNNNGQKVCGLPKSWYKKLENN